MEVKVMNLTILLTLLCCYIILVEADVCVQRSPCSCVFPNGTGIDLERSTSNAGFSSNQLTRFEGNVPGYIVHKQTYLFHPCFDVLMEKPHEDVDSCVGYWSICRYYERTPSDSQGHYADTNKGYEGIGTVRHSHFASDGRYINYSWPMPTKVYLSCTKGEDQLLIKSSDPEIELEFFSRNACLQQRETAVSGLSIPRWMEMQWTKVSQAVKDGYFRVVDGLKWLVPRPLERMPSFIGRM